MSYRVLNNNRIYILQAEVDGAFPVKEKKFEFWKNKILFSKVITMGFLNKANFFKTYKD